MEDVYALMVAEINADASKSPYFQDIMPRKARFHLEMMMRRYASDKAEREMANGSNEKPPEGEAVELVRTRILIVERADESAYSRGGGNLSRFAFKIFFPFIKSQGMYLRGCVNACH